jgi:hypothetical protein
MKAATSEPPDWMWSKPFSELNAAERKAVGLYAFWITQSDRADQVTTGRMVQSVRDPKFNP